MQKSNLLEPSVEKRGFNFKLVFGFKVLGSARLYVAYVVMPWSGKFSVHRNEENGGNRDYTEYEEVEKDYVEGNLHPGDVKPALARHLNEILKPVRDHFTNNAEAKKLLDTIKKYKVTK